MIAWLGKRILSRVFFNRHSQRHVLTASTTTGIVEEDDSKNKIIYNCILMQDDIRTMSVSQRKRIGLAIKREMFQRGGDLRPDSGDAVCLKYLRDDPPKVPVPEPIPESTVQFPYRAEDTVISQAVSENQDIVHDASWKKPSDMFLKKIIEEKNWLPHNPNILNDAIFVGEEEGQSSVKYGTVDPDVPVSDVPCGGCGALLHCQDTSIPGFLPKEIFHGLNDKELQTLICQRCHFLKEYNIALGVNVSPDEYPRILAPLKKKKALVLLMVDVLDMPCSLWPGIIQVIGEKRPIVVVVNKVDLLVQDSMDFLKTISESVYASLLSAGLPKHNIKHVALISAKSGFGVEKLITKIHDSWRNQGDIYLVGCTNVGKSTLFNTLIQSDMCKVQAVDLMQRATVSEWPGTTLNLLRFPVLKPSDWRVFIRKSRLSEEQKNEVLTLAVRNETLKKSLYKKQAPLTGSVGRSFLPECALESTADPFSLAISQNPRGVSPLGLDPNDKLFIDTKWCYDTPGVVHPEQILNFLTTKEIMLTLPKNIIRPRVVHLRPGHSLFIAGLARLDLMQGPEFVWLSVMAAETLPMTICRTEDADEVYHENLGTEVFKVPIGGQERLKKWPALQDKTFEVTGKFFDEVAADLVLSSAGWVGVTLEPAEFCTIRAWTPEARGIHLRPPFLKKAHKLKGRRITRTPVFKSNLKWEQ